MAIGTPYEIGTGTSILGVNTVVIPVGHVTAAGDAIVVGASVNSTSETIPSCADSQSNKYVLVASHGTKYDGAMFIATAGSGGVNPTTALGLTDTITVTYSSLSVTGKNCGAIGCSGIAVASLVDAAAEAENATGTSSPSVATGSLLLANELLCSWEDNGSAGGAITWSGSWSPTIPGFEAASSNQWSSMATQVVSSTASVTATGTITSAAWAIMVISLRGLQPATAALTVTPAFAAATTHTVAAAASLTVTPSLSAAATRTGHVTAALTVTPAFSAAATRTGYIAAALTVTPVLHAAATRTGYIAAALTVTPVLHAAAARTGYVQAALTVTPALHAAGTRTGHAQAPLAVTPSFSAAATHASNAAAALTVTPAFSAAGGTVSVAAAQLTVTPVFTATVFNPSEPRNYPFEAALWVTRWFGRLNPEEWAASQVTPIRWFARMDPDRWSATLTARPLHPDASVSLCRWGITNQTGLTTLVNFTPSSNALGLVTIWGVLS
jgi:hypothetical protein